MAKPISPEQHVLNVLRLVGATNSLPTKEQILRANDSPLLRQTLVYALDPFRTYGIKQLPSYERRLELETEVPLETFFGVLDRLASRQLTGLAAIREVQSYLACCGSTEDLCKQVLFRDLRCGLQIKTVNKAFKGLIREYSVMKAQDYEPKKHKPPFIGEVKMDGKRDTGFLDPNEGLTAFLSRNGLPEKKYKHIQEQLGRMAKLFDEPMVIDGELMWGMFGSRSKNEADAVFIVFDILTLDEWEGRRKCPVQVDRTARLKSIFDRVVAPNKKALSHIKMTTIRVLETVEEIQAFYEEVVSQGGEGLMLKRPEGVYEKKRSKYWLKLKPECDADLEIVGVEGGTGKYEGMLGAIVVNFKGKKVNVGSGFTDAFRQQYKYLGDTAKWKDKMAELIGRTAEVKYTEITPDGALRFPRFVKLREDK